MDTDLVIRVVVICAVAGALSGLFFVWFNREELRRAHEQQLKTTEELKIAQQNLRFYLQEATRAQEEERKRISHELPGDLARNGKLGLAGMQERAQLVGGVVTVRSEPGRGTEVVLEIKDPARAKP